MSSSLGAALAVTLGGTTHQQHVDLAVLVVDERAEIECLQAAADLVVVGRSDAAQAVAGEDVVADQLEPSNACPDAAACWRAELVTGRNRLRNESSET